MHRFNSIRFLYLLLLFLTPIIFTSYNSELFELPKMYFVYAVTLFILIFHLYNYFRGQVPLFKPSFLDWPLVIFLSSQILSTIFSVDVHTSIFGYYSRLNGGLLSLLAYAILYWILIVYIDDKFKNSIINLSLISGFLIAAFGIAEHFGIDKNVWIQDVQTRVFSTLGQPNWLAAYLCILLPFTINKVLSSSSFIHRSYSILLTSSFYLCLLYTKSKSGIIAAVISLTLYFLIKLISDFKNKVLFINNKRYLVFFVFIILSLTIPNPIRDVIFSQKLTTDNLRSDILITPSEDIRKIVWQGSLDLWKQFPIIGTGPETFAYTYYWTRPAAHNLTSEWDFIYNKAHNEYLNYLATTGSFGFLAYLFLIIVILFQTRNSLSVFASFLSILITNFSGFSVVIVSLYFFLLPTFLYNSQPSPPKSPGFIFKTLSLLFIFISCFLLTKTLYYYLADIIYAQADAQANNQIYSQALQSIRLSLNYRPSEPVYLMKSADILGKMALTANNQHLDEQSQSYALAAVDAVNQATLISPFSLNLWKERAQVFYYLSTVNTDYYLKAIDSLTKATLLAPTDAKSFYLLAEFYQNIKEFDQSIKYYQQAIDLKPNYDHAYFALGKIYFDQKKYDLAKINFTKTLSIAPANTDAQNYLNLIATSSANKK